MNFQYLPTSSHVVRAIISAINEGKTNAHPLHGDHEMPPLHVATYEWDDGTYVAVGLDQTVICHPK